MARRDVAVRVYILLPRAFATLADSTISMTRWLRSWQRSSSNLCNSKPLSPWLAGLFVGLEQSRVELCQDSVIKQKKVQKKAF
jgi:hypothetical protein